VTYASTVPVSGQLPSAETGVASYDFVLEAVRFEPTLRRVLARYTKYPQDVPDLIQEVYLRVFQWSRDCPVTLRCAESFFVRIARNVALDWLRKREAAPIDYLPEPEDVELADTHTDTAGLVECEQELECLARIVAGLSPRRRRVFTLRKVYGLSQKEIAQRLHISENTVEQHVLKALREIALRANAFSIVPAWQRSLNRLKTSVRVR
jgi:RNA polymerase sigma factor (sigma-70 family)